jgi:hypothetical protein
LAKTSIDRTERIIQIWKRSKPVFSRLEAYRDRLYERPELFDGLEVILPDSTEWLSWRSGQISPRRLSGRKPPDPSHGPLEREDWRAGRWIFVQRSTGWPIPLVRRPMMQRFLNEWWRSKESLKIREQVQNIENE